MDLETLARRLDYELGEERERKEVLVLSPGGRRYDLLSLNWDDEHGHWLLVTEPAVG